MSKENRAEGLFFGMLTQKDGVTNGLGNRDSSGDPVYRGESPGGIDHPGNRAAGGLVPFYFQKGFAMLCGMTVGDYIRQRRLSAAGLEVLTTDRKIIDIALEFGYDSPDSFTKAFARFHGLTPAALRKKRRRGSFLCPLRIKVTLEGGQNMDCKIMKKKEAFTVLCRAKTFKYEDGPAQVPQFWAEHFAAGGGKVVCGMYGINLDESMGGNEFEYLIADNYDPAKEIPDGFTTRTIPAHTWAVFPVPAGCPRRSRG